MLVRGEFRYVIELSKVGDFIDGIKAIAKQKKFPTSYNHTIYFNNTEHEVPFEVSIKGRKYSNQKFLEYLSLDDKWIFEIKEDHISEKSRLRMKKRRIMTLKEILTFLSQKRQIGYNLITSHLKPYVGDSYRRLHFYVEDNLRVTIDEDLTYYLFEDLNAIKLGNENYARIEIKVPPAKINSPELYRIQSLLNELGGEETISKKDAAYNLLSRYLREKSKRKVPPSDTEIEAKLLIRKSHQYIFHRIKRDFRSGLIKGYSLLEEFPYTLENGKLHKYLIANDNYIRLSIKGMSRTITSKEDFELVNDPYGLKCIIKRRELKKHVVGENLNLHFLKTIYRKRKYFLVENKENNIPYCIILDRSTYSTHELFQIEIEGLLLSPSKNEEKKVIKDISYLTSFLIRRYPILKPTALTKLDWVKQL